MCDVTRCHFCSSVSRCSPTPAPCLTPSHPKKSADGRHVIDEKFQALVLDEIAGIKAEVQAEKEERISEDEQIVGAINEYTRALQDGLRIVSS